MPFEDEGAAPSCADWVALFYAVRSLLRTLCEGPSDDPALSHDGGGGGSDSAVNSARRTAGVLPHESITSWLAYLRIKAVALRLYFAIPMQLLTYSPKPGLAQLNSSIS